MPEGPSIVILKEAAASFIRKKVIAISGNTKIDVTPFKGQTVLDCKTWGKHFLICFKSGTIRIHLMLFGSYRVNDKKDASPRLSLQFKNGELNFYSCSVKIIEEPLDEVYDWSADVMNDAWNPRKAKQKLALQPERMVCDALLDQQIFAGVGNIIKNEVLFRTRIHPESKLGAIPAKRLSEMIREARRYSFEFLEWRKNFVLKKNLLAHNKKTCPRDHIPFIKKHLGTTHRRSFFCTVCQHLYL